MGSRIDVVSSGADEDDVELLLLVVSLFIYLMMQLTWLFEVVALLEYLFGSASLRSQVKLLCNSFVLIERL